MPDQRAEQSELRNRCCAAHRLDGWPRVYVCRCPRDPSLRVDRSDVRAHENASPRGIRRCALHPQISRSATKDRVISVMIAPALLASTAIILLSFVSEDAATISSALSIFGGPLSWPLGFVSCFAGIWLGDLGLYSLARCSGKNVLRSRWLARLTDPATITHCEKTFARNSTFALIASRFVPGTRLPTYLAAGLFAMPARRFALITAIGALVWISAFFALTKLLGSHAVAWFTFAQTKVAAFVFTALFLFSALFVIRKFLTVPILHQITIGARRWMPWEFWPAWLFYV